MNAIQEAIVAVVLGLSTPDSMECLAKNIYFEARNQSHLGQIAVTHVVLNRIVDYRYPDTACEVVQQGPTHTSGFPKRHKCQFSWYCDGLSDIPKNDELWEQAQAIAFQSVTMYETNGDLTNGATHYHAKNVYPYWASSKQRIMRVDDHIFYRWEE
jgi:Cell wall hydrolyses involved in spore germination